MGLVDESGISFPPEAWAWAGRYMVVVLLAHCWKSMGELCMGNNALMAFDSETHHAGVDGLPPACRSLSEPLGQQCVKYGSRRE